MDKYEFTLNILEGITSKVNNEDCILALFTGSNWAINEKIEDLRKVKAQNVPMDIGFSFMGGKILDVEKIKRELDPKKIYIEKDIYELNNIFHGYSQVVVPNITMNTLSKVSLGVIDTFVPNVIWGFLYKNKKVFLDFGCVRKFNGEECKNSVINNQVEKHIENLLKMGAVEIETKKYVDKILPISNGIESLEKAEKTVITGKDLMNLSHTNRELHIRRNTIFTPLAKDRARELGIKIIKEN